MKDLIGNLNDGFLPRDFEVAHDLCFYLHDILVRFLSDGESQKVFNTRIKFKNEEDKASYESSQDIFDWLKSTGRSAEHERLITATLFPAVMSDMLHCIYEALAASRKAKLNITFMLIRKPIQESLYLLEEILIDGQSFVSAIASNPLDLRGRQAGGVEAHAHRIQKVLATIGETETLSAAYLAQLRYSKCEDGFDGLCNHALHLFTEHKSIRTQPMSVNFIFSDENSKYMQWAYLYSRLPYLMYYIWRVLEAVGGRIVKTPPDYDELLMSVVSEKIAGWVDTIEESYLVQEFSQLAGAIEERVKKSPSQR